MPMLSCLVWCPQPPCALPWSPNSAINFDPQGTQPHVLWRQAEQSAGGTQLYRPASSTHAGEPCVHAARDRTRPTGRQELNLEASG
eukprot:366119-Chlamydomonas_euryale.AAC.40